MTLVSSIGDSRGVVSRIAADRNESCHHVIGHRPGPGGAGDRAGEPGALTSKLAREAVDGVLEGEGSPGEVVEKRGLKVVSDDSALEKAAGAIVGAVMKATNGQADAARVREIVLARCS